MVISKLRVINVYDGKIHMMQIKGHVYVGDAEEHVYVGDAEEHVEYMLQRRRIMLVSMIGRRTMLISMIGRITMLISIIGRRTMWMSMIMRRLWVVGVGAWASGCRAVVVVEQSNL